MRHHNVTGLLLNVLCASCLAEYYETIAPPGGHHRPPSVHGHPPSPSPAETYDGSYEEHGEVCSSRIVTTWRLLIRA